MAGVFDISPALEAADSGACLNAPQLEGVAKTLEAAFALRAAASAQWESSGDAKNGRGHAVDGANNGFKYPTLAAIASQMEDEELVTLRAIRECIKVRVHVNSCTYW